MSQSDSQQPASSPDQSADQPRIVRTPKVVLWLLVGFNLLMAFAPVRPNNPMYGWHQLIIDLLPADWVQTLSVRALHVGLQAFWLLVLIPSGITLVAVPFKLRDPNFQLKLAFQMGLFVALIFSLQMMRAGR
jgi:hypothetical protein